MTLVSLLFIILSLSFVLMCIGQTGYLRERIVHNIRYIMKRKEIKQDVFYADTGIHVGRILSAKPDLKISTIEKIAEYLNVSVEELIR